MQPPPNGRRPIGNANGQPLPPSFRRLFHCMRQLGYGALRGVQFRDGNPLIDSPFDVVRKVRTTEKAWPHRYSDVVEFALAREHQRFIDEITESRNGTVDVKVVNGLPVDLEIHERA